MVTFKERRKEPRVIFEQPLDVRVMTIDGTWSGEGLLMEMTDAGARLKMTGHASELTEFFLILNCFGPPGLAPRFYPVLSSLLAFELPCWAVGATGAGAEPSA